MFSSHDYYTIVRDWGRQHLLAYCANNPVMYLDPSGESPVIVSWLLKLAAGFAIADGPLPIGDIIAAVLLAAAAIIVIAEATETDYSRKHPNDYSVYLAYDNEGKLFYVGVSNDVNRRLREHRSNPSFESQFSYVRQINNLSLAQARVIETGIILGRDCLTALSYLTNKRYSIGTKRYPERSLIWNKIKYDILPFIE